MNYLVYLFLSSTFTDMQCERDYIMKFSIPEINKRLKEKNVRVKAVDLRWGIDTSTTSEEQNSMDVIKICMSEIERCRPFFIGLIGERYGWVPDNTLWNEFVLSTQQGKSLFVDKPQSITAAEILAGGIDDEESMRRSFFFFRTENSYINLPPDARKSYISEGQDLKRLDALKHVIRESMSNAGQASHLIEYECDCMAARDSLMSLKGFGDLFEETITYAIIKSLNDGNLISSKEDGGESVLRGQLKTVSSIIDRISVPGSITYVSGPCGVGKSTLLNEIANRILTTKNEKQLLLSHVGNPDGSMEELVRHWNDELGKFIDIPVSKDVDSFHKNIIAAKAKGISVVIILDDIDRIDLSFRLRLLKLINDNCTWILSGDPSYFSEIKRRCISAKEIVIPLISQEDLSTLLLKELLSAGKSEVLSREIISAVSTRCDEVGVNSFYPLWGKLASTLLLNLDSYDYSKSSELDSDGGNALKKYILSFVQSFSINSEGLFELLTQRACRAIGYDFVNDALAYLALSYDGLSLMDLQELMAPDWTDLKGAYLLRYYIGAIRERQSDKHIVYEHQIFKDAVKKTLAPSRSTLIYRNLYNLFLRYYSGNGLFFLSLHSYSGNLIYSGVSVYAWLSILAAFIKESPEKNLDYVFTVLLRKDEGYEKIILEYVAERFLADGVLVQNILETIAGEDICRLFMARYMSISAVHKALSYGALDYITREHGAIIRSYNHQFDLESISLRCEKLLEFVRDSDVENKTFYLASLMFIKSQTCRILENYIVETDNVISFLHQCPDIESNHLIIDQLYESYLTRLIHDYGANNGELITRIFCEARDNVRHSSANWPNILRLMIQFNCLTGEDSYALGCELLGVAMERRNVLGAQLISLLMAGECAKLWSSRSSSEIQSIIGHIKGYVDDVAESPLPFNDIIGDVCTWLWNCIVGLKKNSDISEDILDLVISLFNLVSKTHTDKLSMSIFFSIVKEVVGDILSKQEIGDDCLRELFYAEKDLMSYLDELLSKYAVDSWNYEVYTMVPVIRGRVAFLNAILQTRIVLFEYETSGETVHIIPSLMNLVDICDQFRLNATQYMMDYIGCEVLFLEVISHHLEDKSKPFASVLYKGTRLSESDLMKTAKTVSIDKCLRRLREALAGFDNSRF